MKPYIKNYTTSLLSRPYTFLTTPFSYAKVFLPRLRYTHLLSTSFLLASLFFLTSCACTGDGDNGGTGGGGIGEKSSEAQITSLELTIAGTDETITFDNDDNATVTVALPFTTLGNSVTVKTITYCLMVLLLRTIMAMTSLLAAPSSSPMIVTHTPSR